MESTKTSIKLLQEAADTITHGDTANIDCFMRTGSKHLRVLNKLLRNNQGSIGQKQSLIAAIGQIKGLMLKIKNLRREGGGLQRRERRSDRVRWAEIESAFQSRIRTGAIINLKHIDINSFMADAEMLTKARVANAVANHDNVKINTILTCEYSIIKVGEEMREVKYFNTRNVAICGTTDLSTWFRNGVVRPTLREMEEFQGKESGWTLRRIVNLTVNINRYNPLRAGSYLELPGPIKRKQACVNVQNADGECFKWALLSALHPVAHSNHPHRVAKYTRFADELNFTGIEFPVMPRAVPKFERQNDMSINVYILRKKKATFSVSPTHITANKKDVHINLLLVQSSYVDDDEEQIGGVEDDEPLTFHYVWIKDLSRLVHSQLSKHKTKKYICDRCLHYFHADVKLDSHLLDCMQINKCRVNLPSSTNNIIKFKNQNHKERVPYIVYADFECILKRVTPDPNQANKTNVVQVHEAFSIGYYISCSYDDSRSYYRSYRGAEPAKWFAAELQRLAQDLEDAYESPVPMTPLTLDQQHQFTIATTCHICEKSIDTDRVRDHCHFTGNYRGAAHNACNVNYQDSRAIPVVFHNLGGYDGHFLIKDVATCFPGRINLLPQNKERYISFTKNIDGSDISFRFIDSFKFMASSLDKLASYMPALKILPQQFQNLTDTDLSLLRRKGVFPYEFLDCWEKLEATELPEKAQFFSNLTGSNITDTDYEHAKSVWVQFGITSLGEYSDLYLKTDVLLLADVFENFRNSCLQSYQLDPAHYYTLPGFTWSAMLKYTEIELELLTDIDMLMFVERGIRGGLSQCSNRYALANNKHMPTFNPNNPSTYIMYFDVNNLYGWAMAQHLPTGGFKWVDPTISWDVPDDSPIGYILEVDLAYPEELHDAHQDLPLCPEQAAPPGSKEHKLLATLSPKLRYVIHYRNLQQAVKCGLRITQIHRILSFNQSPWLKGYIDLNSSKRKEARNEFEKNLFKLMNNAVFGKTMENVRKRIDVKLVTKWSGRYGAEALISRPNFHSRAIFAEDLVAIQLAQTEVMMNKPTYVGFCVLDISKTCVYAFHYDYIVREFSGRCKLLYTDTDSLIYELRSPDVYEVMRRDIHLFDTSDYPVENQFNMPQVNKKVVGLMKDECNGLIVTEFVGLRSKMYSMRVEGVDHVKKAKGVSSAVVRNTITFDDYVECLRESSTTHRTQHRFRSARHEVQTVREHKLALSPYDDKRCLQQDTTDTLPWGHYKLVGNDAMNVD